MNNSLNEIVKRYNELQPANVSKFTPRQGFYLIQDIFEVGEHLTFYQAKTLWKERLEDPFIEGAEFTIQLTSLQRGLDNPNTFNPESLRDKVVNVLSLSSSTIEFNKRTYPLVVCKWIIHPGIVDIKKPKLSFFDTWADDISASDINNAIQQSLPDSANILIDLNPLDSCYDALDADLGAENVDDANTDSGSAPDANKDNEGNENDEEGNDDDEPKDQ